MSFIANLESFEVKIGDPSGPLQPIKEEFQMRMQYLQEIRWEIEKLQTSLEQNWMDIENHRKEIPRWAVPLYILVGGALGPLSLYLLGGGGDPVFIWHCFRVLSCRCSMAANCEDIEVGQARTSKAIEEERLCGQLVAKLDHAVSNLVLAK